MLAVQLIKQLNTYNWLHFSWRTARLIHSSASFIVVDASLVIHRNTH